MTMTEYRTMFALWCLVKSPLMLGSDLTKMTKDSEAYGIITNERLLAINQDELGNIRHYTSLITQHIIFLELFVIFIYQACA